MGFITEVHHTSTRHSILVEEDPDAYCREGPVKPGCDKMYFQIHNETRVLRDEGCDRRSIEEASAADLKAGQRVRADHRGYDVAESYPGQTTAHSVVICDDAQDPADGVSSPAGGVFFPKLKKSVPTQLVVAIGELSVDERGCLRVDDEGARDDRGWTPLWTPQYELDTRGGGVQVLDAKGRVVARVGEEVRMGGGGIDRASLAESDFMDERLMRQLFERCPGDYWIVFAGDVNIPR